MSLANMSPMRALMVGGDTASEEDGGAADSESGAVSMDELLADLSDFSVYDDMKAKLIAAGIPEKEIAFIHDYKTPLAKQKLFDQMNRGEMRILFGSTPKLGAGTNVQKRLVALHHIDAPWRPSDLEQREGRIIRQGNELYARDPEGFEVVVNRYGTAKTYDARMWQIIEDKARGIEGFRKADRTTRRIADVSGEAANASDMKAAVSGEPVANIEARPEGSSGPWEGVTSYDKNDTISDTGFVQRLDNYLASFEAKIEEQNIQAERSAAGLAQLETEIAKPFAKEKDLERVRAEHEQVKGQLMQKKRKKPGQQQGDAGTLGTPAEPELDPRSPLAFRFRDAKPGDYSAIHEGDIARLRADTGIEIRPQTLDGLSAQRGGNQLSGTAEQTRVPAELVARSVRKLELVFGKRIIFAELADSETQGFTHPSLANTIVINSRAREPLMALVFHELGHNTANQRPDLYRRFADFVLTTNPPPADYRAEKLPRYQNNKAAVDREWVNDMLAERAGEPEFWRQLAATARELDAQEGVTVHSSALRDFAESALAVF